MCRWSEQETGIRKQHGRRAAQYERHEPDPAEALKGEARSKQIRYEKRSGHDETKRRNVPWREAGLKAKASHDDASGPDADCREAVECSTRIFGSRALIRGRSRHAPPPLQGQLSINNRLTPFIGLRYRKSMTEGKS